MPRTTTRLVKRKNRVPKPLQLKVAARKQARKDAEPVKFVLNSIPVLR